jgi:hypothetical protein
MEPVAWKTTRGSMKPWPTAPRHPTTSLAILAICSALPAPWAPCARNLAAQHPAARRLAAQPHTHSRYTHRYTQATRRAAAGQADRHVWWGADRRRVAVMGVAGTHDGHFGTHPLTLPTAFLKTSTQAPRATPQSIAVPHQRFPGDAQIASPEQYENALKTAR